MTSVKNLATREICNLDPTTQGHVKRAASLPFLWVGCGCTWEWGVGSWRGWWWRSPWPQCPGDTAPAAALMTGWASPGVWFCPCMDMKWITAKKMQSSFKVATVSYFKNDFMNTGLVEDKYNYMIIVQPKKKFCLKCSHPQVIQDVDEFVSSLEQVWINLALHHLFTNGCSAVNGCRQNENPNSW